MAWGNPSNSSGGDPGQDIDNNNNNTTLTGGIRETDGKTSVIPCGWDGNCYGNIIKDITGTVTTNTEFGKKYKLCRGVGEGLLQNKNNYCPMWRVYKDGRIKPDNDHKITDAKKKKLMLY